MLRALTVLFIGFLLGSCSDELSDAKGLVQEHLGTKKAEFTDLSTFAGGVVCGQYVVKTPDFRIAIEKQVFIAVREKLHQPPGQQEWDFYCGDAPGEVLLSKTGIGPYDSSTPDLAKVTVDMTVLDAALESYYRDHHFYPTAKQGMQALVVAPEDIKTLERYPSPAYLEKIPLDPWGRPYLYLDDQWGRTKGSFTITTLGADGIEGGDGINADISSVYLPYLQHLDVLMALE